MARVRRRSPPERGWFFIETFVVNTHQAVDNVTTQHAELIGGSDIDDEELLTNSRVEYLLRRLILDVFVTIQPAATNLSQRIFYEAGLVVADTDISNNDLGPLSVNNVNSLSYTENVARLLQWEQREGTNQFVKTDGQIANFERTNLWRWDLSWPGGINIRDGHSLLFALGQSPLAPWVGDDSIQASLNGKALFQKRMA